MLVNQAQAAGFDVLPCSCFQFPVIGIMYVLLGNETIEETTVSKWKVILLLPSDVWPLKGSQTQQRLWVKLAKGLEKEQVAKS